MKLEDNTKQSQKKLNELREENQKLSQTNENLEDFIAIIELKKASNTFRFQNIPKDKEEDLLGIEKEEMEMEIDQTYRATSSHASKHPERFS